MSCTFVDVRGYECDFGSLQQSTWRIAVERINDLFFLVEQAEGHSIAM